jgi:hypothetical protein
MEKDKNSPAYHNDAHDEMERSWEIIEAVSEGTLELRRGAAKWLPLEPAEDQRDFAIRLRRAIFFNAFERTLHALVGMVFRKDPELSSDNPPRLVELWENIDNAGTHGAVFAREAFELACKYGHSLIYVDMPPALPEGSTLADERAANRRPYWVMYEADQIVNWRFESVNGQTSLSLLVLEEETLEADGLYGEEEVCRYRVLRPGSWELYREVKNEQTGRTEYILEGSGQTSLPYIPVAPIYARKTGILTSKPPLLDLALINLAHYQKYSDYSTYLHIASRPILWFRGRDISKGVEAIGPYTFFDVDTQNGTVAFAETSGAALGAAKLDIEHLEKQMAVMGLSLLAGSKVTPQTATESLLDHAKEESDLASAARSLQDALELALQYTAAYEGIESGSIALGSTMADLTLSPEEMRVWIDSADKVFSKGTIYEVFKQAGKLPDSFDAEAEQLAIERDAASIGDQLLTAFDQGRG